MRNCDRVGSCPNLPGHLKALDAIHVATAEALGADLVALVSYDRQMIAVAPAIGLPVASPGMER